MPEFDAATSLFLDFDADPALDFEAEPAFDSVVFEPFDDYVIAHSQFRLFPLKKGLLRMSQVVMNILKEC
jgi:hypothetical protein